jgi:hypothetical protein
LAIVTTRHHSKSGGVTINHFSSSVIYANARDGDGESTYNGGSAYGGGFGLGLGSTQYVHAPYNNFGGSSSAGGGAETS